MEVTSVRVAGARLEVDDVGAGEPVLFIPTALTADELLPLATHPALDDHRRIAYHRRGYATSSPVRGAGSIAREVADGTALLRELGIDRVHVVGLSFSAAIALQLAADRPELVRTLTLIEPPPVHTDASEEFRAANERLLRTRHEYGAAAALDEFLTLLVGPDWVRVSDERLPGSSAQMERDAATFFDVDIPALLAWEFGPAERSRVTCPVLYVGGDSSGPWFAAVRDLMLAWFPHAEELVVEGADHSLALTHAPAIAVALADFLRRHPIAAAGS